MNTPGTAANSDARKRNAENRRVREREALSETHVPAWAAISEDWKRPTLARVTFDGSPDGIVSRWWRVRDRLYNDGLTWFYADEATSVTVLHTYDPDTHVPVERALIAEAFDFIVEHGEGAPTDLERRLRAALTDGAKS